MSIWDNCAEINDDEIGGGGLHFINVVGDLPNGAGIYECRISGFSYAVNGDRKNFIVKFDVYNGEDFAGVFWDYWGVEMPKNPTKNNSVPVAIWKFKSLLQCWNKDTDKKLEANKQKEFLQTQSWKLAELDFVDSNSYNVENMFKDNFNNFCYNMSDSFFDKSNAQEGLIGIEFTKHFYGDKERLKIDFKAPATPF